MQARAEQYRDMRRPPVSPTITRRLWQELDLLCQARVGAYLRLGRHTLQRNGHAPTPWGANHLWRGCPIRLQGWNLAFIPFAIQVGDGRANGVYPMRKGRTVRWPSCAPGMTAVMALFAHHLAWATGSEMSGLRAVAPLAMVFAAIVLPFMAWLIQALLPRAWPRAARWPVAVILAPVALGFLLLLMSGPSAFHMLLARLVTA